MARDLDADKRKSQYESSISHGGYRSDLVVRVARLHFEFGLTHQETADSLGLSRVKVTRMVKQARESGLVRVVIASDVGPYAELEQELMRRFGLLEVVIVPPPGLGNRSLRSMLAQGIMGYITRVLRAEMTIAVGLSRTIGEAARLAALGPQTRFAASFVSLVGALREDGEGRDSPFGASATLARAFGSSVEHVHAPIIVRSGAVAQELMRDPAISKTLERAATADLLLAGVGGKDDRIDYAGQGYLEPHEWEELIAAGMEGDICARFFDRDGQAIEHEVSARVIGLDLDELKKIPSRVIAAGGSSKLDAIRAVLRGRLATVLITDAGTAQELLTS
ncbi:MAG: putative SorC family transcriptional regulator [Acidimicrobiaceae bacterium]|nr:putative SorC family transcriptional regulator [Acidimicrobiaceae bacterium]